MDGGEEAGPYHLVLSSITLIARPPVVHVLHVSKNGLSLRLNTGGSGAIQDWLVLALSHGLEGDEEGSGSLVWS